MPTYSPWSSVLMSSSVVSSTGTQLVLQNYDGTQTTLTGTGFTLSAGNAVTGGTVTGMVRIDTATGQTLETLSNSNFDIIAAMTAISEASYADFMISPLLMNIYGGVLNVAETAGYSDMVFDDGHVLRYFGNNLSFDSATLAGFGVVTSVSLYAANGSSFVSSTGPLNVNFSSAFSALFGAGDPTSVFHLAMEVDSNYTTGSTFGSAQDWMPIHVIGGNHQFTFNSPQDVSLYYVNSPDAINANMATGVVTRGVHTDIISGSNQPNDLMGSIHDDTIVGEPLGMGLSGFLGNDTITGGDSGDDIYGGTGNDTVNGMGGVDYLSGDEGDDTIDGGDGDDHIYEGSGADEIIGGAGIDTLSYGSASTGLGIVFNLLDSSQNSGDAAGDTTISIENVNGTAQSDRIYMDNGANVVVGYGGIIDEIHLYDGADTYWGAEAFDYVLGGGGGDTIDLQGGGSLVYGEAGDDTITALYGSNMIFGGDGVDTVTGGYDADAIFGGAGADVVNAGWGDDFVFGEAGIDTIHGENGGDLIQGNADGDFLYGDAGVDIVLGGDGGDTIEGRTEDDFLFGEAGIDTIRGGGGNEQIYGGGDGDILYGDAGFDIIFGGDGDDTVNGGSGVDTGGNVNFVFGDAGNDTIVGTAGQDQMWGGDGTTGAGADIFMIGGSNGFDIIFDFEAGAGIVDIINLAGNTAATSFAELVSEGRLVQEGAYTHILLGTGNDLYLQNVTVGSLVADDFAFV